jgi:hypothetical protein
MRLAAFCAGSVSRMITRDCTNPETIAACIVRKSKKVQTSLASKQPSEARTKITRLTRMTGRRPTLSDKGPISSCNTVVIPA